jgi:predicted dehydrogenase
VLAAAEESIKKNLAVGVGLQRHHQAQYTETIKRLKDGAIGDITSTRVYWNGTTPWVHTRAQLESKAGRKLSEMEYQLRNWYYFTWICGDHIVEQHIHNIDVANWALQGHPVKAVGVGGRQVRVDPDFGQIFDHFGIQFEYESGAHLLSMCRQIDGCANHVGEHITGTAGTSDPARWLRGATDWEWGEAEYTNPYVQEHTDLIASIRAGEPLNEGRRVAESTLTAIMGREAAYTGQEIIWDELMAADMTLVPDVFRFGPMPTSKIPTPGVTQLERDM